MVKQMELLDLSFPDKMVELEESIPTLNVVIMKFYSLTLPKLKEDGEIEEK